MTNLEIAYALKAANKALRANHISKTVRKAYEHAVVELLRVQAARASRANIREK